MQKFSAFADFTYRVAAESDLEALDQLIERAIASLQDDFLSPEQVKASRLVMGLDTQLVRDGTYFMIERGDTLVGCGGWSWRSTLYGGDVSLVAREPAPLDPATDAARIRAMYTNPDFVRQGIGRGLLGLCENAARAHGFRRAEMMATLAGEPLYRVCGYEPIARVQSREVNGVSIPLIHMGKSLV